MKFEDLENVSVEPEESSTVKITAEVPYTELEKHKEAALKELGKNVEIDGFRKGHIPEDVLIERVGETALLSEMAERAIRKAYPAIVAEKQLEVVGYPQVAITKLAKDNPLAFTATVAVVPEVKLPDYRSLAATVNKDREAVAVTDEELEAQIKDILRQKVAYERLQSKAQQSAEAAPNDAEKKNGEDLGDATELPTPESESKKQEGASDDDATPTDDELPELTDEYVKTLGQPGQFESVEDFRKKLREHMEVQKKQEAEGKHRGKITDAIIEGAEMEVPEVMVEAELNQLFAQMEEDLKRAQLSMEDYLGHVKKTREDLKAEWRPSAEKRAKLQLVLNEIAKRENITPDPEAVEHEVGHLLEQYKDADRERVRVYVESVLTNDLVMKLLEEQ